MYGSGLPFFFVSPLAFWKYKMMRIFTPSEVDTPTVVPTESDSDVIFCLQSFSKTLTCTGHLKCLS